MGSQFIDGSQGWGGIASGMASAITGAPATALHNIHAAEVIRDQRLKRAQEEEKWNLGTRLVEGVEAATPAAYVAPRAYTAADLSNPAVLDAPLSVTDRVSGTYGGGDVPNGMFTDPRALKLAEDQRAQAIAGQRATLRAHPEQWAPQMGLGMFAAGPQTSADFIKAQTLTTGRMPTAEERSQATIHNLAVYATDPATGEMAPTGRRVATQNGQTEFGTGKPLTSVIGQGEKLLATGPAATEAPNPLGNEGAIQQTILKFTNQVGAQKPLSVPEATLAAQALGLRYGHENKLEKDNAGRIIKFNNFQKEDVQPIHEALASEINRVLGQAGVPATADQPAVPPRTIVATGPQTTVPQIVTDAGADKSDALASVALEQVGRATKELFAAVGGQGTSLPAQPRIPSWLSAVANEKASGTQVAASIMNATDPGAWNYYTIAKRLVEPILRLASGAAINKGEYSDYYQMFIPAPGDTPQMVADKFNALNHWRVAVATAHTANGVIAIMEQHAKGNTAILPALERIKVKVQQSGRGDTFYHNLPGEGGGGGGGSSSVIDDAAGIVLGGR